jgi:hypothetical protein
MAFGLCCSSPMGVCSLVFGTLFSLYWFPDCISCITSLEWILNNEDGTMFQKEKKKTKVL